MNQSPPDAYIRDQVIKDLNEAVMKPANDLKTERIVPASFKEVYQPKVYEKKMPWKNEDLRRLINQNTLEFGTGRRQEDNL